MLSILRILLMAIAAGNIASKEAIDQDGNRYYCTECLTAGEVCYTSQELSSEYCLHESAILLIAINATAIVLYAKIKKLHKIYHEHIHCC
jgi:hypothetical protein